MREYIVMQDTLKNAGNYILNQNMNYLRDYDLKHMNQTGKMLFQL